jgi:hypothetical protein
MRVSRSRDSVAGASRRSIARSTRRRSGSARAAAADLVIEDGGRWDVGAASGLGRAGPGRRTARGSLRSSHRGGHPSSIIRGPHLRASHGRVEREADPGGGTVRAARAPVAPEPVRGAWIDARSAWRTVPRGRPADLTLRPAPCRVSAGAVGVVAHQRGEHVLTVEHRDVLGLHLGDATDRPDQLHVVRLGRHAHQMHPAGREVVIRLPVVAARAGGDDVLPGVLAPLATGITWSRVRNSRVRNSER